MLLLGQGVLYHRLNSKCGYFDNYLFLMTSNKQCPGPPNMGPEFQNFDYHLKLGILVMIVLLVAGYHKMTDLRQSFGIIGIIGTGIGISTITCSLLLGPRPTKWAPKSKILIVIQI